MPLNFFTTSTEDNRANRILILDFDGTVARPDRKENGSYDVNPDGSINASPLDQEKFRKLVQCAIDNNIPLYFVTGRPDIPGNRNILINFIKNVDGFHSGVGGFKENSLYFTSIVIDDTGVLVNREITTKAAIIEEIHITQYPHCANNDFLFIDDIDEYLIPAAELGYRTLKANPDNLNHFNEAMSFMSEEEIKQEETPLLSVL